ncbi:MAG: hypothetical protein RR190_02840, partial [Bacteroidales bacterium]
MEKKKTTTKTKTTSAKTKFATDVKETSKTNTIVTKNEAPTLKAVSPREEVEQMIQKVVNAQKIYRTYSQQQVDEIFRKVA